MSPGRQAEDFSLNLFSEGILMTNKLKNTLPRSSVTIPIDFVAVSAKTTVPAASRLEYPHHSRKMQVQLGRCPDL